MKYAIIKFRQTRLRWKPLKKVQRNFPFYLLWILAGIIAGAAVSKRFYSGKGQFSSGELYAGECVSVCSKIEACLRNNFPSEYALYGKTVQSGCIVKCPKHIAKVRNCVSENDCGNMIPCYIRENR